MKILIFCSGLDVPGGYEKMVCSLANALSTKGHRITLLVAGAPASFYPLQKEIEVQPVQVSFGIGKNGNYLTRKLDFLQAIRSAGKRINALQPDVVISTEYPLTVATAAAGISKKFRHICWHHNAFDNRKSFFWEQAIRISYRRADVIVALNPEEQSRYRQYNPRTIVIPNFVTENHTQAGLNAKRILTIARGDAVKGLDLLLKAAYLVGKEYPGWQWKLISNVSWDKQYASIINKYGIPSNLVVEPPRTPNLRDEFFAASIYALPSRRELFPMVLLESKSYGVPAVAFDCTSGPRHIIAHKVDGLLVEPEQPEQLAAAIGMLIKDEQLRKKMGTAAFQRAGRFSENAVIPQWEQLLFRFPS